MKAITFLGPTVYSDTIYSYKGHMAPRTCFLAEALPTFFPELEQILVFVTPTVEKHANLHTLSTRLGKMLIPIPIPEGHSETDLWEIFDTLTDSVASTDRVIFDITNSFRSLPFLVFLAAAYLRTAKEVKVEAVIYGAFQAQDASGVAPVFDLTTFLSLLDWLTATDQFTTTGDARRLASLIAPDSTKGGPATDAANALSEISLSAFLCQPIPLMKQAQTLEDKLSAAGLEVATLPRPFSVLKRQITETFSSFRADFSTEPQQALTAQLRLIEWYVRNNQMLQAMTLAREWLIDGITLRLGLSIDLRSSPRRLCERAISGVAMVGREAKDENGEKYMFTRSDLNEYGIIIYDTLPERDLLAKLWNHLTPVRNAMDHAGHQADAMSLAKLSSKVNTNIMPMLRQVAVAWSVYDTA